jgi:WD40 repeat protein
LAVVAQLQPSFYNLELPRTMKYCNSATETLPIPSAQSCAILIDDVQFVVGSEDGSLHTYTFMQSYVPLKVKRRHIGPVSQIEVIHYEDRHILVSLGHDNMVYLEDLDSSHTQQVFHESKVADNSTTSLPNHSHDSKVEQGVIVALACNPDNPSKLALLKPQSIEVWCIIPAPLFMAKTRIPEQYRKVARFTTIQFIPKTTALLVGDDGGRIHVVSYTKLVHPKGFH